MEIGEPIVPKSLTLPSDNSNLQVPLHTDLTFSQRTEISLPAAGTGKDGMYENKKPDATSQ